MCALCNVFEMVFELGLYVEECKSYSGSSMLFLYIQIHCHIRSWESTLKKWKMLYRKDEKNNIHIFNEYQNWKESIKKKKKRNCRI